MNLNLDFEHDIVNKIALIDGISIFFIVLFHTMGYYNNKPDSLFILNYLGVFGLVLFTFSSGLKLAFNHSDEIAKKSFLKRYFIKRFEKLYKAYIGYTILILVPVCLTSFVVAFYIKTKFELASLFLNNLNIEGLFKIITGQNFIANHLWYLIALIVITFFCFEVLYYFGLPTLFRFSVAMIILDVILWDHLTYLSYDVKFALLFRIMSYLPVYIFGILFGYKKLYNNNKLLKIISILFAAIFLMSILTQNGTLLKYNVLLYGLTLSPFMLLFSRCVLKSTYIKEILLRCGKYSFQIYLYHLPLILPFLVFLNSILHYNYFFIPYLIAILTIITCIYIYEITKKLKLNKIFE